MKALVTSNSKTAIVQDLAIPEPGPGEIRVKVHAIALNPVDALYVAHPADKSGRVVGSDIAGTIDKLGEGVTRTSWAVGDRVAGLLQGATSRNARPGGFAEYAILEQDITIKIPSGVTFQEAATFPLCSLTAAQALFIRLGIPAPFPSPFTFSHPSAPVILIYSAATSVGLFAIGLAKLLRTPSGEPYRIFGTASPKNFERLKNLGVEAVYDYKSETWPEDVKKDSGGVSFALDCISEDSSTAMISRAFVEEGGKIAVIRKAAWHKEGVREGVQPLYGAAWSGLGHEIEYNNETLPASPSWREFTVAFYKFLSARSPSDPTKFPISGNPIRLMPGGLERIVSDGFSLLGYGKVSERVVHPTSEDSWLRPISGEKLVYNIAS